MSVPPSLPVTVSVSPSLSISLSVYLILNHTDYFLVYFSINSTGLVTAARARVKTGLVVYLAKLEQQNLLSINGQLLGPVTKR